MAEQAPTLPSFRSSTSIARTLCPSFPAYQANIESQIQLPRNGWMTAIYGVITVSLTTSGAGTYSVGDYLGTPSPYGFIRRLRLASSAGFTYRNYDGMGQYLEQRAQRLGDPAVPLATLKAVNTNTCLFAIPSSPTTSTTYTCRIPVWIEVPISRTSCAGPILLDNQAVNMYLFMTWGLGTDIIQTSGGAVTVNSVTWTPNLEYWTIPADPRIKPIYNMVKTVTQMNTNVTGTGEYYDVSPPLGGVLLWLAQKFFNNGARMNPLTDFGTGLRMVYNSTQYIMNETIDGFLLRLNRLYEGASMPDGVFLHQFQDGNDDISNPDMMNGIQTADTTDLKIITDIGSGVSLSAAQVMSYYAVVRPMGTS